MPQSYEELRTAVEDSAKPHNGFALASLVLGALSLLGGITALPGIFCGIMGLNKAKREGTSQRRAVAGLMLSLIGISVGLAVAPKLYHLFRRGDDVSAPDDSDARVHSADNLHRIGIGLQNFDADRDALPLGAICDDDGEPLLSWRVAILPYIDQTELYLQFKLDEPWDSPANKPLIAQMPKIFATANKPAEAARGETFYKVFVGEKAIFSHEPQSQDAKKNAESLNDWNRNDIYQSPRGLANTALVIEAGDPVPWTKPADLTYAEDTPLPNLKSPYAEYVMVLMGDGRVLNVRFKNPDFEAALRASINPNSTSPHTLDR